MGKTRSANPEERMNVKLTAIIDCLEAQVILNKQENDIDVEMACGADLMSDVLSFTKPGSLLLTGLTTPQVVYTAEMADIKIICFVRGKTPQAETVRLAEGKNIVLLHTNLPMFESCGRLYNRGFHGCVGT